MTKDNRPFLKISDTRNYIKKVERNLRSELKTLDIDSTL